MAIETVPNPVPVRSTNVAMTALRLERLPDATAAKLIGDAICWVRSAIGVAEKLSDTSTGDDAFDGALWGVIHMLHVADATLCLAEEASPATAAEVKA